MAVVIATAGKLNLFGDPGPEFGRQRLPLDGQHPVALEVTERAVVRDDLEPVAERLEPPSGTVPAVRPPAGELGEQRSPLVGIEADDRVANLVLRNSRAL